MADVLTFERYSRREAPRPGGGPYKGKAEFFDRRELDRILQVYSRKVMAGEWRDYAIGGDDAGAVFAIYGHASPWPLFCIAKRPNSSRRKARHSQRRSQLMRAGICSRQQLFETTEAYSSFCAFLG